MTTRLDIASYLDISAKVKSDDLNWSEASLHGISEGEKFVITYFADIEGQTIVYLRDFLQTKMALEPEVIAFLSMWNYEEYFHGRVLSELMKVCGHPLEENRINLVRKSAKLSEIIESGLAKILSVILYQDFPAVYTTWGAIQELTTLKGYEQIIKTTRNPVLKTIAERIAKQERRHFAWYYNSARQRLSDQKRSQKVTRALLQAIWSPVGAGVKTKHEVAQLFSSLFSVSELKPLAVEIDQKISELPGLGGLTLLQNYLDKLDFSHTKPHLAPSAI